MKLFRTNVLALALAGAVLVPTLSGAASGATLDKQAPKVGVALNAKAMVDADIVTLGDLFDGVGEKAETPVAYAPRPGKRAYFGARWLYRLARAHNLSWRPLSKHTQAVVERRSQVIGREEIKDAILGAMRSRGLDTDLEVGLTNAMIRIYVPANAPATVSVDEISYDNHSKRFAALLSAPADDPNAQRLRVAGHMVAMTEVPVVNRRVAKGDVIAEADIAWKKIRTDRLRRDTVTRPENLIGKSPIRGLRVGFAIRSAEVRRPLLIKKGDLVTIVLRGPGMRLTAQGKALEHGSDGDSIRVSNARSSQVIDATVVSAGKVTVSTADQMAMAR